MPRLMQPSFARGEISPEIFGRVDANAYAEGLAKAKNAVVHSYGGVSKRPGTKFIGPVGNHTHIPRLIPFEFKTGDSYVLEFGDQYMRVIRNDGHVLESSVSISDITQANPAVVTANSHGFSVGDEVFIDSVEGMTQVNQNRYLVANPTTNTFEIENQVTGTGINSTGFDAYTSGGNVSRIFELATPYVAGDVFALDFVQSADVLTLTAQGYAPRELSRLDHDDWSLDEIVFNSSVAAPVGISATANTTGSETEEYTVTAVDAETGEESFPGRNTADDSQITNITNASPAVVTTNSAHSFSEGDPAIIVQVGGMTELNNYTFRVRVVDSTHVELYYIDNTPVDSTGFGSYTSGGFIQPASVVLSNSASPPDNTVSWVPLGGAIKFNVYKKVGGIFGFIGSTNNSEFTDNNIEPDISRAPPISRRPFKNDSDLYPGAVGYYQQRRVFGGSVEKPDTSEFSVTAAHSNFNRSDPPQDDDAITATLNSKEVNEVRHYLSTTDLLVFTSGSEWRVHSADDATFSTSTIVMSPQSNYGCSFRKPKTFGNVVLFLSDNDIDVRTLNYSLELDNYVGNNLNVLARHLTDGFVIFDWDNISYPDNRVYMIRSDGDLLTLTFDPDQNVAAWTSFSTSGRYESIATLRGGGLFGEDSTFLTVTRQIDGHNVRYIEVMRDNFFESIDDAFFVDSGLSFDNPRFISDITETNPVVITTETAHAFSDGEVVDIDGIFWRPDVDSIGNETQPDQINGNRYTVRNSTSTTLEIEDSDGNLVDGSNFNVYLESGEIRPTTDRVSGLDHLEAREVTCLCDGNVIRGKVVQNGTVIFDSDFSKIHVGLPYTMDLETLNISASDILQGRRIFIPEVTLRFFRTRSMLVGPDNLDLTEIKFRTNEAMGDPTELFTGDKQVIIPPSWADDGRIFLRNRDPVPSTLVAVIPLVEAEDE